MKPPLLQALAQAVKHADVLAQLRDTSTRAVK